MAPERHISDAAILPESDRIANELVAIQTQVNEEAEQHQRGQLLDIRQRLGYQPAEAAQVDDLVDSRITAKTTVVTPQAVATVLPLSVASTETTRTGRQAARAIIRHDDDRLLVTAGPCSIHDPASAMEYARWLRSMRERYGEDLEIGMRAYFEKPRTEVGWKGFTYDPYLDNSNRFSTGLVATRMLLCRITDLGLPVASEPLNALTPQYVNGLVTYHGVGARNVTDQTSRERASGSSAVVGFKNSPDGNLASAIAACVSARAPHDFLGIDVNGMTMQVTTTGNDSAHVILRGTKQGPNYHAEHVAEAARLLSEKGIAASVVVDASHDNSSQNPDNQLSVIKDLSQQVAKGSRAVRGVLIESNINHGKQKHDVHNPGPLEYGVSITDGCVDLGETVEMFDMLSAGVRQRRRMAA